MIRVGIIGLGKMGVSHHAIFSMHRHARVTAVADTSGFLLAMLRKHGSAQTFKDYRQLITSGSVDAVVIALPTRLHAEVTEFALRNNLHVFVEKPFVLEPAVGEKLADMAERVGVVNQVGYHNRFLGTFLEARRLVASGAIGHVRHVSGEASGPVVVRRQGNTWRSVKSEGGGCLHDYCSHVIDLMNFLVGPPERIIGCVTNRVFSNSIEDTVHATLQYANGATGQLAANWSDDSVRKMTTHVTVFGDQGTIYADRQECRLFRRADAPGNEFPGGWTIRYITDLQQPVEFYLRGEEYSAQVDEFIECVRRARPDSRSSFRSALETDVVIHQLQRAASQWS